MNSQSTPDASSGAPVAREKSAPLAGFDGQIPPAPAWFLRALALEPEREFVRVDGANIELLGWGQQGKPGLLFLHGHAAHADVWRCIAPFFARDFRVGALSWSGMGRSDWRPDYLIDHWVAELMEGAAALGLFRSPLAPVVVAHSAGAKPALIAADRHGDRLGGLIVADSGVSGPPPTHPRESHNRSSHRVYSTLSQALSRFRFGPTQPCENLYIADQIARDSLKEVEDGWTWRFDPGLWPWMAAEEAWQSLAQPKCRVAFLVGESSSVTGRLGAQALKKQAPPGTPYVVLPEAHHQLMVDQPLAFVAATRALLAGWGIAA